MRCFRFLLLAAALGILATTPAMAQISTLRLTEVMSSSGVGGTADWWEVTNFGTSAVDLTGWRMDDSSYSFALSVALNGVTSVAPGESALFIETANPVTDIPAFRTFWVGSGTGTTPQIGSYTGSGVGLSSAGDGVVLFNSSGTETTPRISFGAATTGSSFYYGYDAAGDPTTSPNTNAILSTVGTLDGQVTFLSATSLPQNTGSPGTAAITAVPEPSSLPLIGCGASIAAWIANRRRQD